MVPTSDPPNFSNSYYAPTPQAYPHSSNSNTSLPSFGYSQPVRDVASMEDDYYSSGNVASPQYLGPLSVPTNLPHPFSSQSGVPSIPDPSMIRRYPYPDQRQMFESSQADYYSSVTTSSYPQSPPMQAVESVPPPAFCDHGSSYVPVYDSYGYVRPPDSPESLPIGTSSRKTTRNKAWEELDFSRASRKQVGSEAMTTAGITRRKDNNKALLYCPVPGCPSQGFTEEHNLEYHLRSHYDERPFGPCPRCGKSFRSKGDLKRHMNHNKRPCLPPSQG